MQELVKNIVDVPQVQVHGIEIQEVVQQALPIETQSAETIIEVPQAQAAADTVEVPQVQAVEKTVEVPNVQIQDVVRHLPNVGKQEKRAADCPC